MNIAPEDTIRIIDLLQISATSETYQMVLSDSSDKNICFKIKIRPVMVKETLSFQASSYVGTKVLHENLTAALLPQFVVGKLADLFSQLEIDTLSFHATVLVSKKGKVTIKKKINSQNENRIIDLSHNRDKQYILREGTVVPFLVDLGVQTSDGKIVRAKMDKFKQINRFLEFIRDIIPSLPQNKKVHIIDFGCGKSYLTFAMYYYLHDVSGFELQVTGLDLKEDVIQKCSQLKEKYGYDGLNFLCGDISTFEGETEVDMVVTLHACDTATDYALYKSILWNAKVILSVPCCQHELNRQIRNELMEPVLKYGLLKDRISAIYTDAIRANILEQYGYDTQILEFIDMEHTPKNLLIRAVRTAGIKQKEQIVLTEDITRLITELHVNPTLVQLLKK